MKIEKFEVCADGVARRVQEGITENGESYIFDFTTDTYSDLIHLTGPSIYKDKIFNHVYWFGYKFTNEASREERSKFINYIKGLSLEKPTEAELRRFIEKPLIALQQQIDLLSINCFIYPKSARSDLTNAIIRQINNVASRASDKVIIELVKSLPQNIKFDWNTFNAEVSATQQQEIFIRNTLLPKLHELDYFSIAKNVKPKYRKYITSFLQFANEEDERLFKSIQDGKVMLVDDINTSGSTIMEILRIIKSVNSACEIYIFTLIGK